MLKTNCEEHKSIKEQFYSICANLQSSWKTRFPRLVQKKSALWVIFLSQLIGKLEGQTSAKANSPVFYDVQLV